MTRFFKVKNFVIENKFLIFISLITLIHYLYSRFDYNFLIVFILSCLISIFIDKVGHILQYISVLKLDGNLQKTRLNLLISEKKFRDFFNISSVPMVIFNLETESFISTNRKFCDMLGYSEKELISSPIFKFIHIDDIEITKKVIDKKLNIVDFSNGDFTNRYISKEGKIVEIMWAATQSYDGIIYCIAITV